MSWSGRPSSFSTSAKVLYYRWPEVETEIPCKRLRQSRGAVGRAKLRHVPPEEVDACPVRGRILGL